MLKSDDSLTLKQESTKGGSYLKERSSDHSMFSSIIKSNRLPIVQETGKIELNDIVGVTDTTQKVLNTMGIWTPEDAYDIYKNGDKKELKTLIKYKEFSNSPNRLEVLSSIIYSARNIDPLLKKSDIYSDLNLVPNSSTFESKRIGELTNYLKFFGLGKRNQIISLEARGSGVNIPFVENLRSFSTAFPRKMIYGTTKTVKEKIDTEKEYVLDYAFRKSMIGTSKSDLKNLNAVKENRLNKNDADAMYDILIQNGTLIRDNDWNAIRPNNQEIFNKIFASSSIIIGQTANPKLGKIGIISDNRPIGYKGLIFEKEGSKNESIRLKGSFIIENTNDIIDAINILGTNPKNGFAPIGFDYVDDTISESPIFNVITKLPESHVNIFIDPKSIKKVNRGNLRGFEIEIKSPEFNNFIRSNILVANISDSRIKEIGYQKAMYSIKSKEKENLPESQKNVPEEDLSNIHFRRINTAGIEYGGTLCNKFKKGDNIVLRNKKNLLIEMDSLLNVNSRYIKTTDSELDSIINNTKSIKSDLELEVSRKKLENVPMVNRNEIIYTKSKPNCQITDISSNNGYTKLFIPIETPIFKKINKVWNFCNSDLKSKNPEFCTAKLVKLHQNLTDNYFGGEVNQNPVEMILGNILKPQKNQIVDDLTDISREIKTGQKSVKDAEPMTNLYKRTVLQNSKLFNKIPLTTNNWKFNDTIKNKTIQNFIRITEL